MYIWRAKKKPYEHFSKGEDMKQWFQRVRGSKPLHKTTSAEAPRKLRGSSLEDLFFARKETSKKTKLRGSSAEAPRKLVIFCLKQMPKKT